MANRKIIKESLKFPIKKYKHFSIVTILFMLLELIQSNMLQNTITYSSIFIFGFIVIILPLFVLGINLQIIYHIIDENRGLPRISLKKSLKHASIDILLESYYLLLTIIISTVLSIPTGLYHNMYDVFNNITESMIDLEGVNIIQIASTIPDALLSNYINSIKISSIIFIITFIVLFSFCTISKIDLEVNKDFKQTFNIKHIMKIIKKIGIIKYLGFLLLQIIICMVIGMIATNLYFIPPLGILISPILEAFLLFFTLHSFAGLYPD